MIERNDWPALPDGLAIENDLHGEIGAFGRVLAVRDERASKDRSVPRVVRVLDGAATGAGSEATDWKTPLRERLTSLAGLSFPYVATPIEWGELEDGSIYILGDRLGSRVRDAIGKDKGLKADNVRKYVAQLFTGLAALHDRNIAHGDLRPENLFFERKSGPDEPESVWIADAEIGGLAAWSGNEAFYHPEACHYRPPEWKGTTQEPSKKADLYALGLTIAEMLLGKVGKPGSKPGDGRDDSTPAREIVAQLKERKIPTDLRRIVALLLADKDDRPADAADAARSFRKIQRGRERRRWRYAAGALAALVVLVVTALAMREGANEERILGLIAECDRLQGDLANERTASEELKLVNEMQRQDNVDLRIKNKHLDDELAKCREPGTKRQLSQAHKIWNTGIALASSYPHVKSILKKVSDNETRRQLDQWESAINQYKNKPGWRDWLEQDVELKNSYEHFTAKPWTPENEKALAERWSALEQAGNAWIDWANDDAMTADKVQHAINGVSNPAAQAILNRWWGQLNGRSKWTLRLVSGAADPGHTTRRQVSVDGMGNVTWTKGPVHQWDAETGHDYRAVPINERDIAFDWEPGEPFRVVVESYWTYLRGGVAPNQINKTFNGPMAVCRAHHQGGVRKDEEPTLTIWFEIAGCPGPPRSFCKPIFSSSSSVSRFIGGD